MSLDSVFAVALGTFQWHSIRRSRTRAFKELVCKSFFRVCMLFDLRGIGIIGATGYDFIQFLGRVNEILGNILREAKKCQKQKNKCSCIN